MKKKLIIPIVTFMIIGLTACTGALYGRSKSAYSHEDIVADRMDEIVKAIEDKDEEKMKEMFSRVTINSVNLLDTQISKLMDFIDDEILEYNSLENLSESMESDEGNKKLEFVFGYIVVTSEKTYEVAVKDVIVDESETTNEGIHYICVKEIEDYNEGQELYWNDHNIEEGIVLKQI